MAMVMPGDTKFTAAREQHAQKATWPLVCTEICEKKQPVGSKQASKQSSQQILAGLPRTVLGVARLVSASRPGWAVRALERATERA